MQLKDQLSENDDKKLRIKYCIKLFKLLQNYHLPKMSNKLQSNLVNSVENVFKNLIVLLMIQALPKSFVITGIY